MATLSLVIPAYNEEERLPALLETLAGSASRVVADAGFELLETLIVDDGSSDATAAILREAESGSAGVRPLLDVAENQGKGGAVARGVAAARGEYALIVDVDLSTPLEELPKLAAPMRDGADLAIGSRAIEGAIVERGPVHRKLLGKAFNWTVRAITGLRLRDTQCGFKLMPTAVGERLLRNQLCRGFAYDVELLMRAEAAGLTIAEVPVLYLHDPRSKVRVGSASMRMLKDVCQLSYRLRFRRDGREEARAHATPLAGVSADDPD